MPDLPKLIYYRKVPILRFYGDPGRAIGEYRSHY